MSQDEVVVTLAAVVLGPGAWLLWLFRMTQVQQLRRPFTIGVVAAALAGSSILIFFVLDSLASFDVVDDVRYQFMYLVLGLAWLRGAEAGFAFAGLSARDDVVERGNRAAAIAMAGALLGVALCYAGGNIGDGPGWWVVVFSAGLATGTLLLAWLFLTAVTPVADAVTIDRDNASGLRLAGFMIALGLLLGRGVAGDWHSAAATISDFTRIVPAAAVLVIVAVSFERVLRLTPVRPHGPWFACGVMPALVYLTVAAGGVRLLGWRP